MKIGAIVGASYTPMLSEAAKEIPGLKLKICNVRELEDKGYRKNFLNYLKSEAKAIFLLFPPNNSLLAEISEEIKTINETKPIIAFGNYSDMLTHNPVKPEITINVQRYLRLGGVQNTKNALICIMNELLGTDAIISPPEEVAWQGIFYPGENLLYENAVAFVNNCPAYRKERPTVGILFYRHLWLNNNTEIIESLVKEFDKLGFNALPAFSSGWSDPETGAEDNRFVINNYFMLDKKPIIDCLVDLQSLFMFGQKEDEENPYVAGNSLLVNMDVPIIKGIISYSKTEEQWRGDAYGIYGPTVIMSVSMPECNGVIEPIIIGALNCVQESNTGGTLELYYPIENRTTYLCRRVKKWIDLKNKPPAKRKAAIILHNSPCHGVELSVGGAANLDSLESVCRILAAMRDRGYDVKKTPKSGKELIGEIMEKKAISDFRWTPIEEIAAKGGALKYLSTAEYQEWFDGFPYDVQQSMIKTWGNPPGEEKDGVPAAMVYQEQILITGIDYGNVVVCCQPKRGCAGSRCDGRVCKLLHDPECPPTHQYVATYRYLEKMWGADVIIHTGTHGNLEFLPGKSVGLSESCFPELVLGTVPHLYIYNTDNPAEGTIAKRRSYAALIGHMQTVMVEASTYGYLEELENYLSQYIQAKNTDLARCRELEHLITDKAAEANLLEEISSQNFSDADFNFDLVVEKLHGLITNFKNRMHQDGMHILGELPVGERRISFIQAVLKHDVSEKGTFPRLIMELMGIDYDYAKDMPHELHEKTGKDYGALLQLANKYVRDFIGDFSAKCGNDWLKNGDAELETSAQNIMGNHLANLEKTWQLAHWRDKIRKIYEGIENSKEILSLMHGFAGGYIEPGPSGLISRGKVDILPTGRNFYSADPTLIPTKAAWKIGQKLSEALLEKHMKETGRFPENCGMILFSTDCMWTDGEQVSQILALLGVEPQWIAGGKVKGFRIIPLSELSRPRIDVTLRIGGITRDCFSGIIEMLDEAVRKIAALDEPCEQNYIRKHVLEQLGQSGQPIDLSSEAWEKATARIFGSKPNTYGSGVSLAVHASAWKTEQDLADIFIAWGSYAYGKNRNGQEASEQLKSQLATIDLTYNKAATDEYDIFGCCCQFSYYGGLTTAAKTLGGGEVKTYFGDTRDPERPVVVSLAEEVNSIIRIKMLNPDWIEGMKRHGYKGAGDIAKSITHVYGWEATTGQVADWVFDELTKTYVLNQEMREWFEEHNPWALEEINRRLLEASQRGLWEASPEMLEGLKNTYMEIEGWLEERMGDIDGDYQGGSIDIITVDDVPAWKANLKK